MAAKSLFKLNFKPEGVSSELLSVLQERARDIIERRFGLSGKSPRRMTLDAIGTIYGITRERVRQIENFALNTIRKSDEYKAATTAFTELADKMYEAGGLVREDEFLSSFSKDAKEQNHINFLVTLSDSFVKLKEDDHFHHRLFSDESLSDSVHKALHRLHDSFAPSDLLSGNDMISRFTDILHDELTNRVDNSKALAWLSVSKKVKSNPLGEWGLADSPNIHTRGMRDYAYLVLRDAGEPLHFTEIANRIEDKFGKAAHVATTHNELIKGEKFVLVGRGLYALSEWGYESGVVRDVIKSVLKSAKAALTKDEIVKKVLAKRQVKENTIYVNLQNSKYFKKDKQGRYSLV